MKFAVVVATLPFTVEVSTNEFVEVETVSAFVVPLFIILCKSVEVATPFTVEVSIVPEADISLDEITDEVATTPLIVVVSVLPERVCVNEFIKFTTADDIPFIIDAKVLVVVEIVFEFIIEVVETDPPILLVIVLADEESVFGTDKFVKVAFVPEMLVIVALFEITFAKLAVPVTVMLVPVAFSKKRFEM